MLNRRDFIRRSLQAASLSAIGSLPVFDLVPQSFAADAVELAVRTGSDIPALVRETVAALGGMSRFVKAGETVVLKPNIGWDRTVELAANTHPQVVATVALLCLEAKAARVRIFDRTCNDPRRCYVQSGIAAAIEALDDKRVELEHIDRRGYQEILLKNGVALKKWEFYKPALTADRLINLPIAKDHSISVLTLGMKNIMGVIGGNRGVLHRNIDEALADINSVIHSDLTIIDATRILTANGPQGGSLDDVKRLDTLIASADIVAADSYAATLFGFRPEQIPTIVAGAKRGLGVMDLSKVKKV
ncbi:MAG: DUF362 domain-containing protein [Desulfuromonadales bacterium]|nr:DUF362 domain-containing protein [Desulfuromonadales bacterium]